MHGTAACLMVHPGISEHCMLLATPLYYWPVCPSTPKGAVGIGTCKICMGAAAHAPVALGSPKPSGRHLPPAIWRLDSQTQSLFGRHSRGAVLLQVSVEVSVVVEPRCLPADSEGSRQRHRGGVTCLERAGRLWECTRQPCALVHLTAGPGPEGAVAQMQVSSGAGWRAG